MRRLSWGWLLMLVCAAGGAQAQAVASGNRLERVLAANELRVCIWPDYYSMSYRNPRTMELRGIDIDLSADFARELGVKVRYIDSSFARLIENLVGDRCDIAMHGVGITPARQEQLAFTQAYLRSDIYAIAPRSSTTVQSWADLDQPGRVIAVQAGTVMEPVMGKALRHARLLVVRPPMTRENEVEAGRADAFMTDYPYSRRMLDQTDWARLVSPPQRFHTTDYAWALALGDDSLRARADAYLSAIKKDGRLLRFAVQHKLDPIVVRD
jgi:cyclohexadienyl dehydratase